MINNKHAVVVFGSSKNGINASNYNDAMELSSLLAQQDITVITGGGPGIMEAANKGAIHSGGITGAFYCEIMHESPNKYITPEMLFTCRNIGKRKNNFLQYADACIFFPGGYGTLDELFTVLLHIQLNKIKKIPIVLYNREFWSGLVLWLNQTVLYKNMITLDDNSIYLISSEVQETYEIISSAIQAL